MAISNKFLKYAITLSCLATVIFCNEEPSSAPIGLEQANVPDSEEVSAPSPAEAIAADTEGATAPSPAGAIAADTEGTTASGLAKVFNVLDFGVKEGANTDNAVNFIKAWRAACDYSGKAKLLFPEGEFHATAAVFEGPCKAPVDVEILGTIMAGSDISSYTDDFWFSFEHVTGLNVSGPGTVDGQGPNVWKYKEKGGSMLPISLKFMQCEHVLMSGLTTINPMGFHISIVECDDVTARNMHLIAPDDSPNTDGFHISRSNNVKVFDSVVGTGDDCVGVIHGSTDVEVRRVTCGPGHGFSIGSLGKYDDEKLLKNILIQNCTMNGTDNGARIKTYAGSPPSVAANITFQDIIMTNVENPIIIDQFYGKKKSGSPSQVKIQNAKFINIQGTTPTENGVDIQCSKAVPCEEILLSNINLEFIGEEKDTFSSNCTNAKLTYDGPQAPPPCK